MPNEEEGPTQWSSKFPHALAEKMRKIVGEQGYHSVSEFMREACRDKIMVMEAHSSKRIIDVLLTSGKITPNDLREAIHMANRPLTQ